MSLTAYEKFKIRIGGYVERQRTARCWLWHSWGEWKVNTSGSLSRADGSVIGSYLEQKRQCARCKKIQMESQSVYI